jgi:UDP-GlcNAc:undecaprenyl-phosphate/decaprenyl-phosphate GlcNAc-1-phosphate transferase
MGILIIISIGFLTACGTFLCTPLVQKFGLYFGCTDRPDKRKVHQRPMVRIGGVGICLSTILVLCILGILSPDLSSNSKVLWGFLAGSSGFFIIGIFDDIFNIPPLPRLIAQILFSILAWHLNIRVEYLPMPFLGTLDLGILSLPITVVWVVGLTNAINWMDGLDGLAAGICAIAAALFAVIGWQSGQLLPTLFAIAVLGSTLGFLYYNRHPAQLFMGDGGAYFLGFSVAAISALTCMESPIFTVAAVPYLVLAVPILDMTWVILGRLWAGKSPFYPDKRHLHHRLLNVGLSHPETVNFIHRLMLWVGTWAMILLGIPYGWIWVIGSTIWLGTVSRWLWVALPKPQLSTVETTTLRRSLLP